MAETEEDEVARVLTTLGAEVVLRPDPDRDGLILTARMQDPRLGKELSVYLDPDAVRELGAALVGWSIGQALKPLRDIINPQDEEEQNE
jgi:hypothetical protein